MYSYVIKLRNCCLMPFLGLLDGMLLFSLYLEFMLPNYVPYSNVLLRFSVESDSIVCFVQ